MTQIQSSAPLVDPSDWPKEAAQLRGQKVIISIKEHASLKDAAHESTCVSRANEVPLAVIAHQDTRGDLFLLGMPACASERCRRGAKLHVVLPCVAMRHCALINLSFYSAFSALATKNFLRILSPMKGTYAVCPNTPF